MTAYLVHADGKLPNLALMRLGGWLRQRGEQTHLLRHPSISLFDPRPTSAFGSSIFDFTGARRSDFERAIGPIRWGGTGVRVESSLDEIDPEIDGTTPDYSLYPDFAPSIGFLTRGCRLRCGFCVVPKKEGKPRAVASVRDIWRGEGHPKHLHLLDNDAFAPSLRDHWRDAIETIRGDGFRVCFSQGINLRLVDDESAAAIASIRYTGHDFARRRLFTAWDSLGDEAVFRRGVETLRRAGVPPSHLTVYMLVGYDKRETWEAIIYRFLELTALGCDPYPMVFDRTRPELRAFQRWAVRHLWRKIPLPDYGAHGAEDTRISAAAREEIGRAWSAVGAGWKPERRALRVVT